VWGDQVYNTDNKGFLTCCDRLSGKVLFDERLAVNAKALASPVSVGGKLLFVLDKGTTVVVEPGPTPKIAGTNKLGAGDSLDFAASPAIAGGRLYLRSQSRLYCIGEKN
jgi:hypothetical protein